MGRIRFFTLITATWLAVGGLGSAHAELLNKPCSAGTLKVHLSRTPLPSVVSGHHGQGSNRTAGGTDGRDLWENPSTPCWTPVNLRR